MASCVAEQSVHVRHLLRLLHPRINESKDYGIRTFFTTTDAQRDWDHRVGVAIDGKDFVAIRIMCQRLEWRNTKDQVVLIDELVFWIRFSDPSVLIHL